MSRLDCQRASLHQHRERGGETAIGGSNRRSATAFPHTCPTYAIAFVPARRLIESKFKSGGAQAALLAAACGSINLAQREIDAYCRKNAVRALRDEGLAGRARS